MSTTTASSGGSSGDGPSDTDDRTGTTTSDASTSSETTDKASTGPTIVTFGASVSQLTEGETVTFTVIATDPDGIDDLIGGSLLSADGTIAFGAFATGAQEGAYSLDLTWDQIQQSEGITFEAESVREYRAEFFDVDANVTAATVELTLHCDGASACDGVCELVECDGSCLEIDLDSDRDHCGACGASCFGTDFLNACNDGSCARQCVSAEGTNCNEHCSSIGLSCANDCYQAFGSAAALAGETCDWNDLQYDPNSEVISFCEQTTSRPWMVCCCG